jgi:hypothetical protein
MGASIFLTAAVIHAFKHGSLQHPWYIYRTPLVVKKNVFNFLVDVNKQNVNIPPHRRSKYTALIPFRFHYIGKQFGRLILNSLKMAPLTRRNM